MSVPAFSVVGWKDSGKTTLVERLVRELTRRGLAVGTVKHTHDAFLMDRPGTDTDRHRQAGGICVAMVSSNGWTLAVKEAEPTLDRVLGQFGECDIVVVEGFKDGTLPMIEVVADPSADPIRKRTTQVFAVASDLEIDADVPVVPRDEIERLADLALRRMMSG